MDREPDGASDRGPARGSTACCPARRSRTCRRSRGCSTWPWRSRTSRLAGRVLERLDRSKGTRGRPGERPRPGCWHSGPRRRGPGAGRRTLCWPGPAPCWARPPSGGPAGRSSPLTLAQVEELDGDAAATLKALERARELGVRDPAYPAEPLPALHRGGRTEQADALLAEMQALGLGAGDETFAKLAAESSLRTATPEQALAGGPARRPGRLGGLPRPPLAGLLPGRRRPGRRGRDRAPPGHRAGPGGAGPPDRPGRFLARADREGDALEEIEPARAALPADGRTAGPGPLLRGRRRGRAGRPGVRRAMAVVPATPHRSGPRPNTP